MSFRVYEESEQKRSDSIAQDDIENFMKVEDVTRYQLDFSIMGATSYKYGLLICNSVSRRNEDGICIQVKR
ncbi:MAG TPA: hypothetical protein DIW17_00840 [Clostridiales bacterium]|nr:hypothetical protein [Clostridiales bacterium]